MTDTNYTNRHLNVFDILTVLFIGLKITGQIDWSWLLVLSPLFFSLAVNIIFITVAALIKR